MERLVALLWAGMLASCGARTPLEDDFFDGSLPPVPSPEVCNGLDDDLDTAVDEDWRDDLGRFIADAHCGRCGDVCVPRGDAELSAMCTLIEEVPVCAATACAPGFALSNAGRCVPAWDYLCIDCVSDADCGPVIGAHCADLGGERRCSVGCDAGCPSAYRCDAGACIPEGGSCSCRPGDAFALACALTDPVGERCVGRATCSGGVLSECLAASEVCDRIDNDCDGDIDEGFVDGRGAYILDVRHCGECGVDCTASAVPEGDLVCGGDPFAPRCVLDCPDVRDGIDPGDRVDADGVIANGCECTVTSANDVAGPVLAEEQDLDVNCDGADGIVLRSYYVASDGDDTHPGSPSRPLRTIGEGLRRASESLSSAEPRAHVFVASGNYTETLTLPDGVQLHGGYRRDFRALDPSGFRVEVQAPLGTAAPGGAALVVRRAGARPTVIEWLSLTGLDQSATASAAFGAYVLDPGSALVLRDLELRSGTAGDGLRGVHGAAGTSATDPAREGQVPRGAREDAAHQCVTGADNRVTGGRGGRNSCGGQDVRGGVGGSASCPSFASFQGAASSGNRAGSVPGGTGGAGGQDSRGPTVGSSCTTGPICCGLADFTVPTDFVGPRAGVAGGDGTPGRSGTACTGALGSFDGARWRGDVATRGTHGSPGSGAGGGGAGGGAEMDWQAGVCEFADGIGGGGGGGGAGGCGGRRGLPGTSGAPSVALLIRRTGGAAMPTVRGVTLRPSSGGRGGDGGGGGDGGQGGTGALGGALARATRATPTLAGPFPGARGGTGGNGGAGGGGGGGCGGPSAGVWVTGIGTGEPPVVLRWRADNTFQLGPGGLAGQGGGGASAAPDGAAGGAIDVVVR